MNTKSLLLLTLGAALLLPLAGQAKPEDVPRDGKGKGTPPIPAKIIERLDADGSGTISADEAKGPLAKNFERVDADGDGEITKSELARHQKERKGKAREVGMKLKEADTDGNRAISADEAAEANLERLVQHFDKIDADGDGEISKEEMHEMARQMEKLKQRKGGADE